MKYMLIYSAICLVTTSYSQVSSWNGYYEGQYQGAKISLTGDLYGSQWNATIDENGYLYELKGNIIGSKCYGTFSDPQTGVSSSFNGTLSGNQIQLIIKVVDPYTDANNNVELNFEEASANRNNTVQYENVGNAYYDPYLIGKWRRTESYVSSGYSFVTEYYLQLQPNGIGYYTDGRTIGGGSDSSIDSGSGDVHQAEWKSENKILWANFGQGWIPYARYYVDQSSLMLTFDDGSKMIWERI